ncbi:MAG: hypothetical protein WD009_12045, partial [Phycisphaeraceae bacterium]
MSLKYQRVKQADLDLPAPLRWLTRAFSSITLAVILLSLVCVYAVLGSVPVFMLLLGGIYLLIGGATLGPAAAAGALLLRLRRLPLIVRLLPTLSLLAGAGYAAWHLCLVAYEWAHAQPALTDYRATVLYRLPGIEMTELEFYSAWPMQLLLILFVLNMIWATIRRIELSFPNIGVLTVHSGIVVIALGSSLYGQFKLEGDTILWRRDLGGTFESSFYDATTPALFINVDGRETMFPLTRLPRYNDYDLGELDIPLDERPGFADEFGPRLRMSIPGFVAYGDLRTAWRPLQGERDRTAAADVAPGLPVTLGDEQGPGARPTVLIPDRPADRVLQRDRWAIEYLVDPDPRRIADLRAQFPGPHGLVIDIPGHDFRRVYPIQPGMRIEAGDTGYAFTIQQVGPYQMPFVTEGYERANDTHALVHVQSPDGEHFTRIVLHRYPERSQDFVPRPGDDQAAHDHDDHASHDHAPTSAGPLGDRRDPDPAVHLAYLDNTRVQYHVIAPATPVPVTPDGLEVIIRLPDMAGMHVHVPDNKLRLPDDPSGLDWIHLGEPGTLAGHIPEPLPVPAARRDPSDEGTYVNALVPILIEVDGLDEADAAGSTWRRLVWLRHMRYPHYPDEVTRPIHVDVPGIGRMRLAFSRQRHALPFALALDDFEMQPYPGSDIPRDFLAQLSIADVDADGLMHDHPEQYVVHMNNPVNYRAGGAPLGMGKVKVSQVAWDPPSPDDPQAERRNEQGRLVNQQRFTVIGIGNNVGIRIIFVGACMVALGIPWAFYIKPLIVRRRRARLIA